MTHLSTAAVVPSTPTKQIYDALQSAYDHYNRHLFGGKLPPVLFVLQRKTHTMGYISYSRWQNAAGACVDELAVNPEYFLGYSLIEVLSTLCHEMAHSARRHLSKVPEGRRNYHDKEWARIMLSIGLMPSDTGKPGGKRTGQRVGEYVLIDGGFYVASLKLLYSGFALPWLDRRPQPNAGYNYAVYNRKGEPVDYRGRADKPLIAPLGMGAGDDYEEPATAEEAFPAEVVALANEVIAGMLNQPLSSAVEQVGIVENEESYWVAESVSQQFAITSIEISPDVRNPFMIQPITDLQPRKPTRLKYTCGCGNNVWGRPGLKMTCDDCDKKFVREDSIINDEMESATNTYLKAQN